MWMRRGSKITCLDLLKLDGTVEDTKLLRTLVHWVMRNNLLTIINKYPAKQASRDFNVSYGKLRSHYRCKTTQRVILREATPRTGRRGKG